MLSEKNVREYERGNIPKPGNPAYNEAWALLEAARRIAGVIKFGDFTKPEDKRKLRDSLRLNLRIWTIIQAELSGGESPLPEDVRRNILTLCKFIDNHTVQTMLDPSPDAVVVLIEINRNIAAGLLGSQFDEVDEAVAAETEASSENAEGGAPKIDESQRIKGLDV